MQKTQKSQRNTEREKQGWTRKLQNFKTSYKVTVTKTVRIAKRMDKEINGTQKKAQKQTNIVNRSLTKKHRQFNAKRILFSTHSHNTNNHNKNYINFNPYLAS